MFVSRHIFLCNFYFLSAVHSIVLLRLYEQVEAIWMCICAFFRLWTFGYYDRARIKPSKNKTRTDQKVYLYIYSKTRPTLLKVMMVNASAGGRQTKNIFHQFYLLFWFDLFDLSFSLSIYSNWTHTVLFVIFDKHLAHFYWFHFSGHFHLTWHTIDVWSTG